MNKDAAKQPARDFKRRFAKIFRTKTRRKVKSVIVPVECADEFVLVHVRSDI
jgi:hypothetical protein